MSKSSSSLDVAREGNPSEDGGVSVLRRVASGKGLSLLTIGVAPLTVFSRSRAIVNGENFRWTVPTGTVRAAEFRLISFIHHGGRGRRTVGC